MWPQITIGILMYNEEHYIAKAIESAQAQTYRNLKIVIADNCSTDNSFAIAERYAALDPRIELHRHSENKGPLYNYEFILKRADTTYFVTLGAHDLFLPNYIEDAVALLESDAKVALAYPGGILIDAEGKEEGFIQDNYDTRGLNVKLRMTKIARNFNNGYVIHGVFRTEILKKLPVLKIISPDFLIILLVNMYGSIARIPANGFVRRIVKKETAAEQRERHQQQGIYTKLHFNPYSLFVSQLFRNMLRSRQLSLPQKLSTIPELKKIFSYRYEVNWKEIFRSRRYY